MSSVEFSYRSKEHGDLLFLDGPLIDVAITAPLPLVRYLAKNNFPPHPIAYGKALVDTGAAVSALNEETLRDLSIPSVEALMTQTAHGIAEMKQFNASVSFPGLALMDVPLRKVIGGFLGSETADGSKVLMLLGRDLLQSMVVVYDGPAATIKVTV